MLGTFCAVTSAICSTSKDIYSKRVSSTLPSSLSTFSSFAFALPYYSALLTVLYLLGHETFAVGSNFFIWILLRSVSDAFAESFKMKAFAHGDLSLVSSFLSLSPLFILITSLLLTGDPLRSSEIIAIGLTLIGTLVITYQPERTTSADYLRGILYAVGASLFFSLNTCFDKLAVTTASPTLSACAVTCVAALMFLPAVFRQPDAGTLIGAHLRPLAIRGFFELAFMVAKLYALTIITAPSVVGIQRISLLLSIIAGRVLFREKHFARRLIAGIFIASGVVLIALSV